MIIDRVKPGDRVEITNRNKAADDMLYKSKVEAIPDKIHVILQAPSVNGRNIKLPTNTTYSVLFLSESGMFRFDGEVTGYAMVDGIAIMRFKLNTKGERVQRRGFFRFDCLLTTSFVELTENGEQVGLEMHEGTIRDLSGGGLRMFSTYNMDEGVYIRAMLKLDEDYVMVFGQVLHKQYHPDTELPYQYRVIFKALDNTEQEKIVRFIYNEQRRSLRRV